MPIIDRRGAAIISIIVITLALAVAIPPFIDATGEDSSQTVTQTEGDEAQLTGTLSADLTSVRDGMTFDVLESIHTTDTDFNSADTLENVTVEGSGDSAYVNADFSGTFEDDFEDSDISDYTGQDGSYSTITSNSFSGSVSVRKTSGGGSFRGMYLGEEIYQTGDVKNLSGWRYYSGSGSERGGVWLSESDGTGYLAYFSGTDSNTQLSLRRTGGDTDVGTQLDSDATGSHPSEGWYKVFITQDGNTITAEVRDDTGAQVLSTSATDSNENPTRPGVMAFDTGTDFDLLVDEAGTSNVGGGERAIYIGSTHSVNGAESGFANVSLTDSNAVITWEADTDGDGTFETEVSQVNESTSGNYTADLSTTSGQNFRVNVTFVTGTDGATGELHDEGITSTTTEGTDVNVTLIDGETGQTVETGAINESETRQFTIGFETVTITNEDVLSGNRSLMTYEYPTYYGMDSGVESLLSNSPLIALALGFIIVVFGIYAGRGTE